MNFQDSLELFIMFIIKKKKTQKFEGISTEPGFSKDIIFLIPGNLKNTLKL